MGQARDAEARPPDVPLFRLGQVKIAVFRHPEESRNVMDNELEETVKELATIDGAFVVRSDGVIESCGVLLKPASQEAFELPRGLGARHHAAAGITAVTKATAVTVSESTGNVMVFRGGKAILEVEKIRLGGTPPRKTDPRPEGEQS